MQGWKIALLIIIGILFVLTSTTALVWYSISSTALNANTYKQLVSGDMIEQLAGNQIPKEILGNLDTFVPVLNVWIDSIFGYVNGKTANLQLQLPDDAILKPLLLNVAKTTMANTPGAGQLTDEQINTLLEQQYPVMKTSLQTQLDDASKGAEAQLNGPRDVVSVANTIAMILLIISIVLLVIVVLLIRQIRSIFNWIGSYLLATGVLSAIIGLIVIAMVPLAMGSSPIPAAIVSTITSLVSSLISPIIIVGAIVAIIGFAMLFIKYAFKKPEDVITKK